MDTTRCTNPISEQLGDSPGDLVFTEVVRTHPPNAGRRAYIVGIASLAALGVMVIGSTRPSDGTTDVVDEVPVVAVAAESSALLDGDRFQLAVDRAVRELAPPASAPNALLDGHAFARAVSEALDAAQQ